METKEKFEASVVGCVMLLHENYHLLLAANLIPIIYIYSGTCVCVCVCIAHNGVALNSRSWTGLKRKGPLLGWSSKDLPACTNPAMDVPRLGGIVQYD